MAKGESASAEVLNVPVKFTGFSAGDETARLGLVFNRDKLSLNEAEFYLCGARANTTLTLDPNAEKDGQGQQTFDGDDESVETVVDIKKFTVSPKKIGASLTFNIEEIDIGNVAHLAQRSGKIRIQRVGDAQSKKRGRRPKKGGE